MRTATPTASGSRAVLAAALLDLVAVTAFVVIGRSSHGEDPLGVLHTLWPFAVGAAVGWLVSRAWRAPLALVPTGLVVWLGAVVIGVALRAATGDGAPVSFVIVTTLVLAAFLLGWRAVAAGMRRVARGRADRVRNTD